MSWIVVDIETDGPVPGLYSMVQVGAIVVREPLAEAPTFFGQMRPVSSCYNSRYLNAAGLTREQTLRFDGPASVMRQFYEWVNRHGGGKPRFASDNCGFDHMFVEWYSWSYLDSTIFGHQLTHIGSLFRGLARDAAADFKHLRDTPHTHNPVDDARGNAEALLKMRDRFGLDITFE